MIDREILEIFHNERDRGELLNAVADQFRLGRDVCEILVLLDSSNAELVSVGAWMLGEQQANVYNYEPFISRLHLLVDHEDPEVRFHAFGALFPLLQSQDDAARNVIEKLRNDPNEGVRRIADAAVEQQRTRYN